MSPPDLVFQKILSGIPISGGHVIDQVDVVLCPRRDGLCDTAAVVGLTRVTACGWLIPSKHQIIVFSVAVAHFRVILGSPDVTLDAEVLLPRLVYQARETILAALHARLSARPAT